MTANNPATRYNATETNMGSGWTDARVAANRWNTYIAPILREFTPEPAGYDQPECPPIGGRYAHEWAWEEFCGREAGESDEAAITLAEDLRAKLEA